MSQLALVCHLICLLLLISNGSCADGREHAVILSSTSRWSVSRLFSIWKAACGWLTACGLLPEGGWDGGGGPWNNLLLLSGAHRGTPTQNPSMSRITSRTVRSSHHPFIQPFSINLSLLLIMVGGLCRRPQCHRAGSRNTPGLQGSYTHSYLIVWQPNAESIQWFPSFYGLKMAWWKQVLSAQSNNLSLWKFSMVCVCVCFLVGAQSAGFYIQQL